MRFDTNFLATIFIKQREIIEAAETPFAKLTIFVLPVLAPLVPAFMTSIHLFKLFLELFDFSYSDRVSLVMVGVTALVLEMLGYVGAISFIKSLFDWIKTRKDEYLLPFILNGGAYTFYLVAMYFINVKLGQYFGTPAIVNSIFGLLSFITVPSGLLAANHLNEVSSEEREEKLRQEKRVDSLERYKIRHGVGVENGKVSKKVSNGNGKFPESFYKSSTWRTLRPGLSKDDLIMLSNLTPADMQELAQETGLTYKTISNWRTYASQEVK